MGRPRARDIITIYFDLETLTVPPFAAYALGYSFDDKECYFIYGPDCVLQFVDIVASLAKDAPGAVVQLMAFNGLKFDYQYLLPHMLAVWGSRVRLTGSRTNIKVLRAGNVWCDDLRMLFGGSGSLRRLTAAFLPADSDLHKGEFDFSRVRSFADVTTHRAALEVYLRRDVLSMCALHRILLDKLSSLTNKQLAPSFLTVSLSSVVLKHIFPGFVDPEHMPLFRSVLHKDRALMRSAYHGGRVTCANVFPTGIEPDALITEYLRQLHPSFSYRLQMHPLHYLDINSSYPYAMTKAMPCGTYTRCAIEDKHVFRNDNLYMIEAFSFTSEPMLPVVTDTGVLMYPLEYGNGE